MSNENIHKKEHGQGQVQGLILRCMALKSCKTVILKFASSLNKTKQGQVQCLILL